MMIAWEVFHWTVFTVGLVIYFLGGLMTFAELGERMTEPPSDDPLVASKTTPVWVAVIIGCIVVPMWPIFAAMAFVHFLIKGPAEDDLYS